MGRGLDHRAVPPPIECPSWHPLSVPCLQVSACRLAGHAGPVCRKVWQGAGCQGDRIGSTAKVLAKCMLKYYKISEYKALAACGGCALADGVFNTLSLVIFVCKALFSRAITCWQAACGEGLVCCGLSLCSGRFQTAVLSSTRRAEPQPLVSLPWCPAPECLQDSHLLAWMCRRDPLNADSG